MTWAVTVDAWLVMHVEGPAEIMGYLPKGLSDYLRSSPGLRAFLDMEPLSDDEDTKQPPCDSSADPQKGRTHHFDQPSDKSKAH